MHPLNKNKKSFGESGFTLAETLVVVAITAALMASVTIFFKDVFVDSRQETAALSSVDQARLVSSNFINEIRNATTGADASYPLGEACDSDIIIFTPYHSTGGTLNRIHYYISGTSLMKGVTAPTGSPATYAAIGSASEKISDVLDNVKNGTCTCSSCPTGSTAAFYYYDGNYTGTTGSPLSTSVSGINALVKFTRLNLTVLKQDATGSTATFTVNDGAAIRAAKTNLGN